MYRQSIIVFALISFYAITACAGHKGFTRTPFNSFKTVQFDTLGIQMALPEQPNDRNSKYLIRIYDSEAFQRNAGGTALVFFFHPYNFGGIKTEPDYYLVFNFVKKPTVEDLFNRYKNIEKRENIYISDQDSAVSEWMGEDEYSNRKYYLFQRNIVLPNNEIVSAGAKLLHRPEVNTKEDKDIQFIRQVLDSIEPLPTH